MAIGLEDTGAFKQYVAALAEAMRQEIPDVSGSRAEFAVDGIPYILTADPESAAILACAVIGALPQDESGRAQTFAKLLHAQFCFAESCGFSFGVDADDSFVLLQALVNTECYDERHFVGLMEKFVQTANVWSKRLAGMGNGESGTGGGGDFIIQV
ncbi:MAG: type III secretion system chaperone [Kiritimatiellae bacterium]|nr:type III secretion system chaperone [Kiritimatiellia bacterium]